MSEPDRRPAWADDKSPIITAYDPPPIPVRHFDWQAWRDNYEPGWAIGQGHTEQEAIANLIAQERDP